ncbi:MAG TPA: hypothetical protein VG325_08155 [Solirubrobacteraceae bacterium]|nr:hypothetical protein [Solirubrobacteraceae bacterium]
MASDRSKTDDEPHDVLAAEEYGVPAPDPGLHHGPVELPDDPTGIAEPHDVLAAEEFAMPAPPPGARGPSAPSARSVRRGVMAAGALAVVATRALRKRRS